MILIALGSNLSGPWGTPQQTLRRSISEMPRAGLAIRTVSSGYRTRAYGVEGQPAYINAVAEVDSFLPPEAVLYRLHHLEKRAARARGERWGARTLDLDLIDWKGTVTGPQCETGAPGQLGFKPLSLPHPGIANRPFVILPLAEIAPDWHHPRTGETASSLAKQAKRLNAGNVLSIVEL